MNERIKELAIQAGVYVGDDMWFADELNPKTQLFAQLIIRECSRVAKLEVGTNRVCDAIEKHFGVEP